MIRKMLRFAIIATGGALGAGLIGLTNSVIVAFGGANLDMALKDGYLTGVYAIGVLLFAIIFYILSPKIIDKPPQILRNAEERFLRMLPDETMRIVFGLVTGLLIAFFLLALTNKILLSCMVIPFSVGLCFLCGYFGATIALRKNKR